MRSQVALAGAPRPTCESAQDAGHPRSRDRQLFQRFCSGEPVGGPGSCVVLATMVAVAGQGPRLPPSG
jgi:hypothetical protein